MSNKLEAALGGAQANEFTDDDKVTFVASARDHLGRTVIDLTSEAIEDDGTFEKATVAFWASDAAKIIALIAEAAK